MTHDNNHKGTMDYTLSLPSSLDPTNDHFNPDEYEKSEIEKWKAIEDIVPDFVISDIAEKRSIYQSRMQIKKMQEQETQNKFSETCLNKLSPLYKIQSPSDLSKYKFLQEKNKLIEARISEIKKSAPSNISNDTVDRIISDLSSKLSAPTNRAEGLKFSKGFSDIKLNWICKALGLAPGDSTILVGESGTGKTHLACYLALCFLSGRKIFDQFEVQKSGPIVHLNWDSNALITKINYLRLANGMEMEIPDDVITYENPDWKFDQEGAEENLTQLCRGKVLCIVDSLRSCFDGKENESEVVSIVALANKVSHQTGCAIIFLAHTGKDGIGKKGLNALRGSSAIPGAAGAIINLDKDDADSNVVLVKCEKGRLNKFKPFLYQYEDAGEWNDEIFRTEASRMFLAEGDIATKKASIREQIIEALKNGKLNKGSLHEKVTGKEANIEKEIKKMVEEGLMTEGKIKGQGQTVWCQLTDKINSEWNSIQK